jgi:hypothetical protein
MIVELKGLHEVRAKGRVYYYAWRGGPRIKAGYGTPDFVVEYVQALAARGRAVHEVATPDAFEEWEATRGLKD